MKNPKVTVLMPVYNGENYLKEAIESILSQDFQDFEFLIINDGSTDGSEKIIDSFSDKRIRKVNNDGNKGLVNTLNTGLGLANGEYIARMDCDDISKPQRLSVQVKFMDEHKNLGASGSYYELLIDGKKALADFPLEPDELKCFLVFNCPLSHPSAIIRTALIKQQGILYRKDFIHAEDYDFWSQLSECSDLANLPEVLLTYRVHANQITGNPSLLDSKTRTLNAIRSRHLRKIGVEPSAEELFIHNLVSDGRKAANQEEFKRSEEWLNKIVSVNKSNKSVDVHCFELFALERWLRMCFNFLGGKKGIAYFLSSPLNKSITLPFSYKRKLWKNLYRTYKRRQMKNSK